jgi:hypothetical protein
MFDLFRFMMLRPPSEVDASTTISIDGNTRFIAVLKKAAIEGQAALAAMKRLADEYTRTEDFVRRPSDLVHWRRYVAVGTRLESNLNPEALQRLIARIFEKTSANDVVGEKGFLSDKRRTEDSLVALQLVAPPDGTVLQPLAHFYRLIDLIERAGRDDPSLSQPGEIQHSLNRLIVLPSDLFPVPSPLVRESPLPNDDAAKAKRAQARLDLLNRAAALKEAVEAVNALPVPAQSFTSLGPAIHSASVTTGIARPATPVVETSMIKRAGAFLPTRNLSVATADPQAMRALSRSVKSVLADLDLDLTTTPISAIADRLNTELVNVMDAVFIGAVGPPDDPFHEPPLPQESLDGPPPVLAGPPNSFNGKVAPAGIADLLVVREHVLRYERGEIAFVENVAKGESLKRQTHRKDTTEDSILTTTSFGREAQRDLQATNRLDLQSANRFDLQRQSASIIQQNTDRVPGVGSSEAYGPLVDVGGSDQLSSSQGSQQFASQASNYGQDVTRRAVSKLTESLQTQILHLKTSEFAEDVERDFDNSKGPTNEIMVYQWLDKISEAEVFTYGRRLIYDFIVPEPATFLVNALNNWKPELSRLQKPTLFSLPPHKLDRTNYQYWAAGYGATNLQPPPEQEITIERTYANKAQNPFDGNQPINLRTIMEIHKDDVEFQSDYQATEARVVVSRVSWNDTASEISVVVGQQEMRFDAGWQLTGLNGEVGHIPVVVWVMGPAEYTVAIEIKCVPTDQNMAQWQARTHDTILQASHDRLAEYEDRLNNLKAALQVEIGGKTSEQKQTLVKAELEKGCISILSNQHFDALNAIEFSSFDDDAVPQLFLPNVEPVGRYIRFFQQAFEWDQMMYRYYPYFWGRKKYWNDRLKLDDQDPEFAAFLNAGAARVTLPVRRNFEPAVARFMSTGQIPSEAELIGVTNSLFVPFFAELLGADTGPDTAIPYGEPPTRWEIRMPTTLVKMRTDDTLPRWRQTTDNNGRVTYEEIAGGSLNP